MNPFDEALDEVIDQSPAPVSTTAPKASSDPFASALGEVIKEQSTARETRIKVAGEEAEAIAPDRAADVYRLARRYGLSPATVESNFDRIQKRAKQEATPYAKMLSETPALAEFLSDPHQAAAVKDDIEPLGVLEKAVTMTANSVRSLTAGIPRFYGGLWGTAQQAAEAAGNAELASAFKAARIMAGETAEAVKGSQEGAGALEQAFYSGFESVGMMAPGLLLSAVTGSPAPMLAVMGATTSGEAYGRARDVGKGVGRASLFGLSQGAVEVATELIPASLFVKDLAKNAGFRAMVLHQIRSEVPGEQIATALQDLDEWATFNPDKPFSTYLEARPEAFVQTLVSTIAAVGATSAIAHSVQRMSGDQGKADRAEKGGEFLDSVAATVGSMKTAEKFPESIEQVIAGAAKGSAIERLYMPVDAFTTYWQSLGEDPKAKAAELTGDEKVYDRALATGEDLPIPVQAYAARLSNTEHNAYFVEELKLGPDEFSRREAKEWKEQQAAIAESAAEEAAAPEGESAISPIRASLQQQLEGAGIERDTATNYVDLVESTFSNMASLLEGDAGELYSSYGVKVERPDLAAPEATIAEMPTRAPAPAALPIEKPAAAPALDPAQQKAAEKAERYAPYLDVLEAVPEIDVDQSPREMATAYVASRYPDAAGQAAIVDQLIGATAKFAGTKGEQKVAILDWIRKNERQAFNAPERRSTAGSAPGGVERRNEPIRVMENVGAAAARMQSENPNIMKEAQAMRDRASAAGRIPAPPRQKPGVLDKNDQEAQTSGELANANTGSEENRIVDQGRSPSENRIAASNPGGGKAGEKRAAKHLDRVFGAVLDSARQLDPAVNEQQLREEFDFRVSFYLDQQQLAADVGNSPYTLLREIAKRGGISIEGERSAEIKDLRDKVKAFGSIAGVPGVFTKPVRATHSNKRSKGWNIDEMFDMLKADSRFSWLESIDMLLDQIDEAARHGVDKIEAGELPGTEELRDAGVRRELKWWPDGWAAASMLEEVVDEEIPGEEGDTSFDVTEFNQSLFDEFEKLAPDTGADTLATGEIQPRLPEAGDVRNQEVATPEVAELPFSLTAPTAKPEKKNAGQRTLFQGGALSFESVRQWAADVKTLAGEDLRNFDVSLNRQGDLTLHLIVVARGAQRAGLGSKVVKQLTRYADANGLRIVLSPGGPKDGIGTESRAKLVEFYKRFGFVENKGRNLDLSTSEAMLREPTVPRVLNQSEPATETPAFKEWFGDSKIVDEDGQPLRVFHGTTSNFDTFDQGRGNIESDLGAGFYFSNNPNDVGENYAGEGPDLTSKLERETEQIHDRYAFDRENNEEEADEIDRMLRDRGLDPEDVEGGAYGPRREVYKAIARKKLGVEHGGAVLPVYLKMENPAIIGGPEGTILDVSMEYAPLSDFQDVDIERLREEGYDDDEIRRELSDDNGYTEEGGTLPKFAEALRTVANRFDSADADEAITEIMDAAGYESIGLDKVVEILKKSEGLAYATDDNGTLAIGELIRQAIQEAGFDGIIDYTVDEKFGSQKRIGSAMAGMDADTVHYIAFEPTQIKSAIGNVGTFDAKNPSILYQDEDAPKKPAKRGAIRFGEDRQFTISLLEKADLSTFLHETGHLFLEVYGDVVDKLKARDAASMAQGGAGVSLNARQAQAVADYNAILNWLGVKDRSEITDEQHEKWARGFEAYLMEGRAPSAELRGSFTRFRSWLLGIYRSLRSLNVELTDEVRRVFDRMVATEQAIEKAEQAAQLVPMFTTAESAGMAPAEFEQYRAGVQAASTAARETLELRMLQEVQREKEQTWKAQRASILETVEQETHAMPVYIALAAMQRGTLPNGDPIEPGSKTPPLKLSRKILVDRFGADYLKRLPNKPAYIYAKDGGIDPDLAATMFGYSSADELLRAIENAEPMERRIQRETDRRMIEANGSLLLDGTLDAKANAALGNEQREYIVREELRALANLRRAAKASPQATADQLAEERKEREYERRWLEAEAKLRIAIAAGHKQVEIDKLKNDIIELKAKTRGGAAKINRAIPPADTIREAAALRIARTRVRDLQPQVFWSAARKASKKALDAAARQDFDTAIAEKQKELLNVALYREATRVKDETALRVQRAIDLSKPAAQARLGKAEGSYLEQVNGILDTYDFARYPGKVLDRRQSLRVWVDALKAQGYPVEIDDDVIDDVRRIHYSELTVEELNGVSDALDHIVHLARLKNKLLKSANQRDFKQTIEHLVASIRSNFTGSTPEVIETHLPAEQRKRTIAGFFASHRKLASFARVIDGIKDGGAMWDALIRPLNEAADREAQMNADATKALAEIVKTAYPGNEKVTLYEKKHMPAIGKSLSKMGRLMVALNWGNEGNRDRIRNGYGWTDVQVQQILDSLDERDWRFVQGVWDFIGSYWNEIEAKQKRVTGIAPARVESIPVQTKFGTFNGGYFPLKYNERLEPGAVANLDIEAANLQKQAAYLTATTRRGHTKERAKNVKMKTRLDFGVLFEHVSQVIHDLSHHEMLIDVGRIMGDQSVQKAIYETHGELVYREMKDALRDVAFGVVPAVKFFEKAINHLRVGATVAGLGWNLTTAMLQPLGLTQSIVRVGPKYVAKGAYRWLRDAATMENTVAWIADRSTFMKLRGQTQQREISEIRNQVGVNTGRFSGWVDEALSKTTFDTVTRQGIADSFFFLIQQMQRVADVPTWLGEYEKAMDQGNDEERAARLADQAVLDAQGGGQVKDLAGVQRGGPMMRLWTNFYSFFNTTYNLSVESTKRTNFKKPGQVGRLAVDYLLLWSVPAILGFAVRAALKPGDEDEEELAEGMIREQLAYVMGAMVGVREVAGTIQGFYGYEGPAGARGFASIGKFLKQAEQVATSDNPQEEFDAAFWRSLNDAAGIMFHYPSGQTRRTIEGFQAIVEGDTNNPGALLVGPPKK